MKPLLESWNRFLNEEVNHYNMEVQLKVEPDTQVYGSIFNKIRAIEGVTIIKSVARMEKDSNGNKYINLNIKFLANPAMSQPEFLHAFKRKITAIKDEEGDRILAARIIKLPRKD